ncbi:uncharacterized protein LOC135086425 [Ostrinia nubilalis]|uniref:uncharacterized protein LOC135086425 n=1 Tax=Ostrinia nubilalis TaxID=29057 RepID=UPI0030823A21
MNTVLVFVVCFIHLEHLPLTKCKSCSEIKCSNIIDYVCGVAERNGVKIIKKYHNECHLNRIKCKLKSIVDIRQVSDALCNIKRRKVYFDTGRRLNDFSVVGAHQACNHTCPTYCVDTYEPACAQIWTSPNRFKYRPMINHCHIDLLSCAAGVNVTVEPLAKCYKNPSGLMFMSQVAALKSLRLIGDAPPEDSPS